jgi:hypothetical protein
MDFDAPLSPEADKFLAEATAEFNVKQDACLVGLCLRRVESMGSGGAETECLHQFC